MRLKLLALLASVLLVAACESTPEETVDTSGGGGGVQSDQSSEQLATAGPAAGSEEDFLVNVGDRVFFGFDQSTLDSEARQTLNAQAGWLQQYPNYDVTIEGHADERGTREYNLALGERRANAAREYLIARGVSGSRIDTISYGKERPAVLGSNEAAWAQNRRAVTVLNRNAAPGS